MNYMQQFDTELFKRLESTEDTASIVRWVSEKVLESYKNGIKAGRNGVTVKRQGKSRSKDFPAQAL